MLLFAFLIGAQLRQWEQVRLATQAHSVHTDLTLASAIEAGVSTIFVGLGEDPYVLAARAPALFDVSILQRNRNFTLIYLF